MDGMEPLAVRDAADVAAWLNGPAPGLVRRAQAGTSEAERLAGLSDGELVEQVGRFMRVACFHFVARAWARGYVSAAKSVFISYRRGASPARWRRSCATGWPLRASGRSSTIAT
jgi:hypothetical protein